MAIDPTHRALTDLIDALQNPGDIDPGLARHIGTLATGALARHNRHLRFPALGFPFAAVNGISTTPDEAPRAHL